VACNKIPEKKLFSSIEILKLLIYVSGNETRIGQHFTFSDELHIFPSQRDEIWPGNNLSYVLSLTQEVISLGIFTSDIFCSSSKGYQLKLNLCGISFVFQ